MASVNHYMLASQQRLPEISEPYKAEQNYGSTHYRRKRSFEAFERGTDRQKS